MRRILFFACIGAFLLSACSYGKRPAEPETTVVDMQPDATSNVPLLRKSIQLNALDGYFSVYRPTETTVYILDKSNFETNFHPATTINNRPRMIDFQREGAGAIVLPETEYETMIVIDSAYVSDNTMHVVYTVNKGVEKRTFTTLPVKIFTFEKALGIDSISFENNGVRITVPNIENEIN